MSTDLFTGSRTGLMLSRFAGPDGHGELRQRYQITPRRGHLILGPEEFADLVDATASATVAGVARPLLAGEVMIWGAWHVNPGLGERRGPQLHIVAGDDPNHDLVMAGVYSTSARAAEALVRYRGFVNNPATGGLYAGRAIGIMPPITLDSDLWYER